MKALKYIAVLTVLLAVMAWSEGDHDHGAAGHDQAGAEERPGIAVTLWTENMELFMEYPVITVNTPGRFIIHLTILEGFQPVREGQIKLNFVSGDGHAHEFVESQVLREGIFAPTIELHDAGPTRFSIIYDGPNIRDSFDIENVVVYGSMSEVPAQPEDEAAGEITFLKEQQWKIPFSTAIAETREIKRSVWAIGEVLPSPKAYAEIVSPVDGVVHVGEGSQLALPGSFVKRNDPIATITPPVQGNSWATSQLGFEQAKRDYERAQRLKERQAISERDFERIANEYRAMKAGFEALSGGGDAEILTLKAPFSGKIVEYQVRPGQRVAAGDKLMAIVDPHTVWLRVNVYENDFRTLGRPAGVYIRGDGFDDSWDIDATEMKVLTTGGALDPITRTVPVLIEITNANQRLNINESTPVELYGTDRNSATAIPKSAIYEEEGMDVVFVQSGGESFEKRIVTLGPNFSGWVTVLKGLQHGERVVATGGYHVKLASTTAEIGHGHAH